MMEQGGKMYQRWVKKSVNSRSWDSYYSAHPGYYYINQDSGGVVMGFMIADDGKFSYLKDELSDLSDEEIRQVDLACRSENHRPYPLEKASDYLIGG